MQGKVTLAVLFSTLPSALVMDTAAVVLVKGTLAMLLVLDSCCWQLWVMILVIKVLLAVAVFRDMVLAVEMLLTMEAFVVMVLVIKHFCQNACGEDIGGGNAADHRCSYGGVIDG